MTGTFRERLIEAMQIRNIKAAELSKKANLSKAQISQYVNGVYEAKQEALYKLSTALNVSEAWLMGRDVPMQRVSIEDLKKISDKYDQFVRLLKTMGYEYEEKSKSLLLPKDSLSSDLQQEHEHSNFISTESFDFKLSNGKFSVLFSEEEFNEFIGKCEDFINALILLQYQKQDETK